MNFLRNFLDRILRYAAISSLSYSCANGLLYLFNTNVFEAAERLSGRISIRFDFLWNETGLTERVDAVYS